MTGTNVAKLCAWLLLCGLAAGTTLPAAAQQMPFFVVTHPDNPVDMVSVQLVSDLFLKKTSEWPDGQKAEPVDLGPGSAIRQAFSADVHGRSVGEVKNYWVQQTFSGGKSPPLEVASENEAVAYVREHIGGIAYVSTSASLDGVKLVPLVIPPVAVKKVPPFYSDKALRFRIQGEVVLRVEVSEQGTVEYITVLKGLEHGLTEEAVRAVRQWTFEPATSGGIPISAEIDVTVNFSL